MLDSRTREKLIFNHFTTGAIGDLQAATDTARNMVCRYGMSDVELYDATRSAWRVGPRRRHARYAFSVFEGVVREVYLIAGWMSAGSTFNVRRDRRGMRDPDRQARMAPT